MDHFKLTHPFEPIKMIFLNSNNQSYSLINYNILSAYIGFHSVKFCDDLVLREVVNTCKIPDIKRSKLVYTLMKQNVYSKESSGTASIDTWNCKYDINKEQISDVIDGLTSVNSMYYTCVTENNPIADLTAEFNDLYIHKGTQTDDDGEDSLLQEIYRLISHVCDFLNGVDQIHRARFTQMLRLVKSGQFLLDFFLCYRLFLDIVQWHSINNPSAMRYKDEVRSFWYVGKFIFHGKFLEHMGEGGERAIKAGYLMEHSTLVKSKQIMLSSTLLCKALVWFVKMCKK